MQTICALISNPLSTQIAMTYTTCPKCKEQIEADSWFCDQCGTELFVCPQCKELRKGKRCTTCGTPLVSMQSWGQTVNPSGAGTPGNISAGTPSGGVNTGSSTTPPSAPPSTGSASTTSPAATPFTGSPTGGTSAGAASQPSPAPGSTVRPGAPAAPASQKQPGHIQCANPYIRLGIESGVIIGRRGSYAAVFAPHGMVSGIHAQLDRQPNGQWTVTDLGSTNGSTLNGQPLTPQVPVPFNVGDTLTFANLTFAVLE